MTVTVSSGAIRTKALGAKTVALAGAFDSEWVASSGTYAAMHNPPPIVAVVFRKSRRAMRDDFAAAAFKESVADNSRLALLRSSRRLMTTSFPRSFRRRGEWRGGCAGRFRTGRCCRTWLHQCLYQWAWNFLSAGSQHS